VVELHCTYDPETRGGNAPDGRKVRATLHWVSVAHAVEAEVRLYDHLLRLPDASDSVRPEDFTQTLNPQSLHVLTGCQVEPSLAEAAPGARYQFERQGYFCADARDSTPSHLVFNRTVTLRDTWAKVQNAQNQ
jgi:glutaminyl-tRNA synthetase